MGYRGGEEAMTHIFGLLFVSFVVAVAFAFLMRQTPQERLIFGVKMFLGLVGFAFVAGWIAYFVP